MMQPDLYKTLNNDQAREALFAACLAKGKYLSTMTVRPNSYRADEQDMLVYRPPELVRMGVEIRVSFMMRTVTYYVCAHYPYTHDHIIVCTTQAKTNSAKTSVTDLSKAVGTVLNGLNKRRLDTLKGRYEYTIDNLKSEADFTAYALGIMEQANDIMNIDHDQIMHSSYMNAKITVRKNTQFVIRRYEKTRQMFFTISADCSMEDVLQSVHHMIDNGYNVHHFEHCPPEKSSLSYLTIRMDIETEYDTTMFLAIQDCRIFQRQIANEIEGL